MIESSMIEEGIRKREEDIMDGMKRIKELMEVVER